MNKKNAFSIPDIQYILDFMRMQKRPMRLDGLIKGLGIKRGAKRDLEEVLYSLQKEGKLTRMPGGKWALTESLKNVSGQFLARDDGSGIVVPEKGEEIYIHPLHRGDALHKDYVRALVLPADSGRSGKIVEVVERGQKAVVARVEKREGKYILCRPADRKLAVTLSVHADDIPVLAGRIPTGSLVLLKPIRRIAGNLWEADLLNIFGAENNIEVQEAIVKCNHHVPDEFPHLAIRQAEKLEKAALSAEEREDWRHLPFVTIDGRDARDFDDAIHVEASPDGFILRVAIADVSHYVRPDKTSGSLDSEARKRGNSWYFPRSVEPMLPKILSNGLCSLKPGEDRLAMMAEIGFSSAGRPKAARFAPIVMRSAGRLVYDDVALFLAGQSPLGNGASLEVEAMLRGALQLYRLLAQTRRERGSLDFDLPEPEYKFDENGALLAMGIAQRNDAHCLIEEFMIAANEAVARHLGDAGIPFLYRVHPRPDAQKLGALFETLELTGVEEARNLPRDKETIRPVDIQKILRSALGTPQEFTVNRLCLRAMQQARYQPENCGHFGLASRAYCHFTSPIRRYADLLVHRALKVCLGMEKIPLPDREELAAIGDELNKLEREAMECEREIARRLGCLAIKEKEGKTVAGTVSGVTEFGLFVEFKDIPAEGLARISDLGNEWYEYDQKRQRLVGQRGGGIWRLGQPVEMKVASVDLDRLEIRLLPVKQAAADKKKKIHVKNLSGKKKGFARKNESWNGRPDKKEGQTRNARPAPKTGKKQKPARHGSR